MKIPVIPIIANAVSNLLDGVDNKAVDVAQKAIKTQKLNYKSDEIYNNGVALTPPMGWSSWNLFRNKINENLIYETALAMKNSGLADCGYKYVNLDDCWMSSMRDENGKCVIAVSQLCKGTAEYSDEQLRDFLDEGLGEMCFQFAEKHPEHVKPFAEGYRVVMGK